LKLDFVRWCLVTDSFSLMGVALQSHTHNTAPLVRYTPMAASACALPGTPRAMRRRQ